METQTFENKRLQELIEANAGKYDELFERRMDEIRRRNCKAKREPGCRCLACRRFMREERRLNLEGIRLKLEAGIGCLYGEAMLCGVCKRMFKPGKNTVKSVEMFRECEAHKGLTRFRDKM